jgi:hypothetical protein
MILILLMILPVSCAAHKIRSTIMIRSRNYLISAAPKYGSNFSGIATDPSAR